MLELALVRWALEKLRGQGFEPVIPPVLVREEALYGTGFLPDTEQQIYHLPEDDLYLVGTSEVALASLHAGEILDGETLPLPLRGLLAVLPPRGGRRGQGHARDLPRAPVRQGRDVPFVAPEDSRGRARAAAGDRGGDPAASCEIPYRVVNIARRRPRRSAAKKYDCEAWLPGQERYRELTSTSNTTDYQARRLDIRHRPAATARPRSCTRSTAPRSPWGARSSRCWRTASRPTAAWSLPEALVRLRRARRAAARLGDADRREPRPARCGCRTSSPGA